MKFLHALALIGLVSSATVSTAYADVRLSIDNGHVSLVAKDATLRQILTEWERVGHTKIVNIERIAGGPLTLELQNMPEDQALDLLLRPVSGYLAAPRPQAIANTSRFDRIVVMPTPAAPQRAMAPAPAFNAPVNAPPRVADDDRDDDQPAPNVMPTPNPRGPVFNTFPQPRVVNPPQQSVGAPGTYPPQQEEPGGEPSATPGAPGLPPGTVSTPGMIAPTPAPGQPGAPVRRPGGGPGGV
jgi:hypothetical protein